LRVRTGRDDRREAADADAGAADAEAVEATVGS